MRLFLIRHGETVDNVAGLYAGSRDSVLTNHGVQQATRLGKHFAASNIRLTHVFSSRLQRAVKTAELVRAGQPTADNTDDEVIEPVVAQILELREQDFGSREGVSFMTKQAGSKLSGKKTHREAHKDEPDFVDIESRESMIARVDLFLDKHLLPIVHSTTEKPSCVAVISHGITLSVLWKRILHRMPSRSVRLHPEVRDRYNGLNLEHIGGWSNTAYLELLIAYAVNETQIHRESEGVQNGHTQLAQVNGENASARPLGQPDCLENVVLSRIDAVPTQDSTSTPMSNKLVGWTIEVCAVNSKQHLEGLKRTRGGVGSAGHDNKQKSIDTFFKKRKTS